MNETNSEPSEYGAQYDADAAVIAQYDALQAVNPVIASRFATINGVFDRMARAKATVVAHAAANGIELPKEPNPFAGHPAADRLLALRPAGRRAAIDTGFGLANSMTGGSRR